MGLTIDWTEYDNLSDKERYDAAGDLIDQVKAAVSAKRAAIADDLGAAHGDVRAADILGISRQRVGQLRTRHQQTVAQADPQSTEIASIIHGRTVHDYDLLDEVMAGGEYSRTEAHEAIHAMLADLIDLDGEDEVILGRRPVKPGLLEANPRDLDVYYWLTISGDAAQTIREVLTPGEADQTADHASA
ncbi:hypothetical protein QMK19_03785 [Streptomyces sp. H10-C2]|uniref:hypothetical protein n=1 Tax=unclassified Streptomyces TaxID=2593676 RepID=UPI0024B9055D|nr:MULTISPECIES: hypothetical protein [unclassified Streptomyces]MDJ0345231.1 hypothetical protein [Streptomyces sp. PH10-H1]MDJ0368823.1 hypothetical protein [Streptomyces sp. H10-C2]